MNSKNYYQTNLSCLPRLIILPAYLRFEIINEINCDCFYSFDEEEILSKIIEILKNESSSEVDLRIEFLKYMVKKSKTEAENSFYKQYELAFKEFTRVMFTLFMQLKENICYVDGKLVYEYLHLQGGTDIVMIRSDLDEEFKCSLKY